MQAESTHQPVVTERETQTLGMMDAVFTAVFETSLKKKRLLHCTIFSTLDRYRSRGLSAICVIKNDWLAQHTHSKQTGYIQHH